MQLTGHATEQDLTSEIDSLCDSDSSSYTLKSKVRRINVAYEDVAAKLIIASAGGKWHFGDSNYSSTPTGLQTMTNSTAEYQLMGDLIGASGSGLDKTTPLLTFLGASVLDNGGTWHVLKPISLWKDMLSQGIDPVENFKTDGLPQYYELREDFIILYPAPDNGVSVTLTNGLKVFFQRSAELFTTSDTTKQPGFASPYHILLAYKAALPYCMTYKKDRVPLILNEIRRLEDELLTFYSHRALDEQNTITASMRN